MNVEEGAPDSSNNVNIMTNRLQLQIREGIHKTLFLFFHENLCCDYSLEVPQRGTFDKYHRICFCGEIKE